MNCHVPLCHSTELSKCDECRVNHVCVIHEYVDVLLDGAGKVRTTTVKCLSCRHGWAK